MHMPHWCTKYWSNSGVFHEKVFFAFKLMSRSGILVQKSLKMSLFMENREIGKNREIFQNYLKIHFRSNVTSNCLFEGKIGRPGKIGKFLKKLRNWKDLEVLENIKKRQFQRISIIKMNILAKFQEEKNDLTKSVDMF